MDAKMVAKADTGLEVPESMVYFVFMTMFIDVIAACISTPVMPYYAQEFGVSTAWIGYIYAAWSITSALFAPILSGMADKWGRKRVLVTCLTGAGIANVIQGCSLYFGPMGFWIFLFGRAFSGCFASIGATCNVYITDVCTSDASRGKFLGQMSMVPLVAIMVGPGLGGGLAAAFGNNVPVLIDGIITLFSACVVQTFLEESPAFLRSRLNADVEKGGGASPKQNETKALPTAIYVVGLASFTASLAGQMNLSMYSLFFQKEYDFSALYIGFVFMGNAVVMLLTNMMIVPQLRKCLQSAQMYFGGALVSGAGSMSLGLSGLVGNVHLSLGCVYGGGLGGAVSMSQASAIVAGFTDVSNRGRIFGLIQTFQNVGKIVGPMLATNVAVHGLFGYTGFFGLPFLISGAGTMTAGCVMLASLRFVERPKAEPEQNKLQRKATTFGDAWENETGSEEDIKALGKYVAQLLTDRHYKWVSRRADIEKLLDDVLPELRVESRDAYEESFTTLKTMKMQVACMAQA